MSGGTCDTDEGCERNWAFPDNTEPLLRLEAVVSAAAQLDVLDRRLPSLGEWHDVVELDESRFFAPAGRSGVGATCTIAAPDRAAHRRRDRAAATG